jgi:hypothetical protein
LSPLAAHAQQPALIDFEQSPSTQPGQPVTIGVATFRGGFVLRNTGNLPSNQSAVYFSADEIGKCTGCSRNVTVQFSEPVSNIEFTFVNGVTSTYFTGLYFYHYNVDDSTATTALGFPPYDINDTSANPPWRAQVHVGGQNVRSLTISPAAATPHWDYILDNLSFTVNRPIPVRVILTYDGRTATREVGGLTADASVPLGGKFSLELQKLVNRATNEWITLPSVYRVTNGTVMNTTDLDLAPDRFLLYPTTVLFAYDDSTASVNTKDFQSVHYGSATINIKPAQTSIAAVTLTALVEKPQQLGASRPATGPRSIRNEPQFDERIARHAHRTGIPPQYLKGQIDQESELGIGIMDPMTWRYELYTKDAKYLQITPCGVDPNGKSSLPVNCNLWPHYRLTTGDQLCPGVPIVQGQPAPNCGFRSIGLDDLAPRGRQTAFPLQILRAGEPAARPIRPGDDPVWGYEIYYGSQNLGFPKPPGTPTPVPGRRRAANPGPPIPPPYNFIAQTPEASSYGLMQMLWLSAIDNPLQWKGVNSRYNPALLFDTQWNEDNGGGSIKFGSQYDAFWYKRNNPSGTDKTPRFASEQKFQEAIRNMWGGYNANPDYDDGAFAKSARYTPQPRFDLLPLSACGAPTILSQTTGALFTPGAPVSLGVDVNTTAPARYDWYEANAGKIATTDVPELTVFPTVSTSYWVVVQTDCGSATAATIPVARATSCTAPTLTATPHNRTIQAGETAILSVTAQQSDATYQWYAGHTGVTPGQLGDTSQPLPQGDAPTVQVQPSQTTTYWVAVRGACGAFTTAEATVIVGACSAPQVSITATPHSDAPDTTFQLTATTTGTAPFTYDWFRGPLDDTTAPLASGPSVITVSQTAPQAYWVRVTNACGTAKAAVTVNATCAAPHVSVTASPTSVVSGQSSRLFASATGSTPLNYEWFAGSLDDLSTPLASTASDVTVAPATSSSYWVRVTNACSTAKAAVIVGVASDDCTPPQVSASASPAAIVSGQSTQLRAAFNGTEPVTIEWFEGNPNDRSLRIGVTPALVVSPAISTSYWVQATNACGSAVAAVSVTVTPQSGCTPVSIAQQPVSTAVVGGESATLTVAAGGTLPFTFVWYAGETGDTSTPVPGATSASVTISPLQTTAYWARVQNACGTADTTSATVTVLNSCTSVSILQHPFSTSIAAGDSAVLSVAATGTPPLFYDWFIGISGDTRFPLTGQSGNTITVTPGDTTTYWVRVSNACSAVDSAGATVVVMQPCMPPAIQEDVTSRTISAGTSTTVRVTPAATPPFAFQWYYGASGDLTAPIPGATDAALTIAPAGSVTVWVQVSNACGIANSSTATITVTPLCAPPVLITEPGDVSIMSGEQGSLALGATGTSPLAVQWYIGTSGDTSQPIAGTGAILTVSPETTTSYWAAVTNACGSVQTTTATIIVTAACVAVNITAQPMEGTVTAGTPVTLTVRAAGTSPLSYQWYKGQRGDTTSPLATTDTLVVTPSETTAYWVEVNNACGSVQSATATITVTVPCDSPAITSQPQSASIATGGTAVLSVGATGATPLAYQWFAGNAGDVTSPVTNGTSRTITVGPPATTSYWARVTNGCGSADTEAATVTVTCGCGGGDGDPGGGGPKPVAPTRPPAPTDVRAVARVHAIDITWHEVSSAVTVATYQVWRRNGSAFVPIGTTRSPIFKDKNTVAGSQYSYFVIVIATSGGASGPSNIATAVAH